MRSVPDAAIAPDKAGREHGPEIGWVRSEIKGITAANGVTPRELIGQHAFPVGRFDPGGVVVATTGAETADLFASADAQIIENIGCQPILGGFFARLGIRRSRSPYCLTSGNGLWWERIRDPKTAAAAHAASKPRPCRQRSKLSATPAASPTLRTKRGPVEDSRRGGQLRDCLWHDGRRARCRR